jgi:hypothetical protein
VETAFPNRERRSQRRHNRTSGPRGFHFCGGRQLSLPKPAGSADMIEIQSTAGNLRRRTIIRRHLALVLSLCFLAQAAWMGLGFAAEWPRKVGSGWRLVAHTQRSAILPGSCRTAQLRAAGKIGHRIAGIAVQCTCTLRSLTGAVLANAESPAFHLGSTGAPQFGRPPPSSSL